MLNKIIIHNFRNLKDADLVLEPGLTLVAGDNGHGKTNFLEAIFFVTQGWSFRLRNNEDAIEWQSAECWVRTKGMLQERPFEQGFMLERKKGVEVRVDAHKSKSMADLHGRYGCVYMGPEDIALVRGAPELRRRWVDVLMSQSHSDGLDLLRRFRRVLRQRNSWLKNGEKHTLAQEQWFALTEVFVDLWAQLTIKRAQILAKCAPQLNDLYHQLSGGAEDLVLSYANGTGFNMDELLKLEVGDLRNALMAKMERHRTREMLLGMSVAGAHKDDLLLNFANGKDFRSIGSQGQCRSAALALGLTAFFQAKEQFQQDTTLLLDDIFAELDSQRRQRLAEIISANAPQILAALPRMEDLPFSGDHRLQVQSGTVEYL